MNNRYLYAIDLGNGEVKVGITKNPKARIKTYKAKHNILAAYITPKMIYDPYRGERHACEILGEYLVRGREYFNCSLDVAIEAVDNVYVLFGPNSPASRVIKVPGHNIITIKSATTQQRDRVAAAAKAKGKTITQFIKDWIDRLPLVNK